MAEEEQCLSSLWKKKEPLHTAQVFPFQGTRGVDTGGSAQEDRSRRLQKRKPGGSDFLKRQKMKNSSQGESCLLNTEGQAGRSPCPPPPVVGGVLGVHPGAAPCSQPGVFGVIGVTVGRTGRTGICARPLADCEEAPDGDGGGKGRGGRAGVLVLAEESAVRPGPHALLSSFEFQVH